MKTVVIMPGGFHPFHAGHYALYQQAKKEFPGAEVFVAATNDTSTRPFPFAVKEKLAKLAGVEPGHFVQVRSPFKADEITANFDPEKDVVIFVRSKKDANTPPIPGGVKKDGTPQKLQPLAGAKKLEPFGQRVYMTYLDTVPFAGGKTSASEIRAEWPTLDDQGKIDRVTSLYPATEKNPRLAATVVKILDSVIMGQVSEAQHGFGHNVYFEVPDAKLPLAQEIRRRISFNPTNVAGVWKFSVMRNENPAKVEQKLAALQKFFGSEVELSEDTDYIEEKWSAKYKRSINCARPRGFSQRAHCQGRRKK